MRSNAALHYLDNAATTMVDPAVADAIHTALLNQWANPSSLYEPAVLAQMALGSARGKVAATLGCTAKELYFTSGGTEGNNLAILGAVAPRRSWGDTIESFRVLNYPSVQNPIRALGKAGMRVVEVNPGPDGRLAVDESLLRRLTAVRRSACCNGGQQRNRSQGRILPAWRPASRPKNNRTAVHVDAVQAWLRMRINLKAWAGGRTALSYRAIRSMRRRGSARCICVPATTGRPPILGGGQENGVRPGTENTPYAIGLAAAGRSRRQDAFRPTTPQSAPLNARLRAGLASIPGVTINSPDDAVPEVLNFSQHAVRSQDDAQLFV